MTRAQSLMALLVHMGILPEMRPGRERIPIKATARAPINRPDTNKRFPNIPNISLANGSRTIQMGHIATHGNIVPNGGVAREPPLVGTGLNRRQFAELGQWRLAATT